MKFALSQKRLSNLLVQRNALAGLSLLLLSLALLQSLFLFLKKERVIVTPLDAKQSYWVEGNRFSPSFLEETALFFCHLLLDITEVSVIPQGEVLLRHIAPQAYGTFKLKLLQDEKRLKKEQLSLHFVPQTIQLFPEVLRVEVTGDLLSYVARDKVSQTRETYRLQFAQQKGRLWLQEFKLVKSEQGKDEESVDE